MQMHTVCNRAGPLYPEFKGVTAQGSLSGEFTASKMGSWIDSQIYAQNLDTIAEGLT